MLHLTCPGCGSKLTAPELFSGRGAKCPKCGTEVQLAADPASTPSESDAGQLDDAPPDQHVHDASGEKLPVLHLPERLDRQSHYLICDKEHLAAAWENNGKGWMLKTSSGLISATRNPDQIPSQGDFMMVELKLSLGAAGLRLCRITVYRLAQQWAMTRLYRADDKILTALNGPGSLNREQKNVVRQWIHDQFMREVWADSHAVMDYLANADYHGHGAG